jgi:hypothetical protein
MKTKAALTLFVIILSCFYLRCSDSPSAVQNQSSSIIGVWTGETFTAKIIADTIFIARDFVARLEFKDDSSYYLLLLSSSSGGQTGKWSLKDNGKKVKLSLDTTYTEELPIVLLTATKLVLGDTTSHGYSLVPIN